MSADRDRTSRLATDAPDAPLLGGRYRLDGRIGIGGMGEVHRAWDTRLGRRVAIKVLTPALATDPEVAARLRAEGRHLAATEHPNLVTLYDVSDEPDSAWLVMELVEGESLAQRLRREGPLAAPEVAAIVTGIAAGLSALHGAGIVHRDISPANILLGIDGGARLADLGLAHDVRVGHRDHVPDGMIQGTLRYLAPELLYGSVATPASDVHALAAVTYAALLGRPPAVATSVAALRGDAHREPPIRPSLLRSGLDPAVDEVLLAALGPAAGRPTAYQFAVGVAGALRRCDDREPPPVAGAAPTLGVTVRSPARTRAAGPVRRAAMALTGSAMLLGLGAASLFAINGVLPGPDTTPRLADPLPAPQAQIADPVAVTIPVVTVEALAELAPVDASEPSDTMLAPTPPPPDTAGPAGAAGPTDPPAIQPGPEPTAVAAPLATPPPDVRLAVAPRRGSAAAGVSAKAAATRTRAASATRARTTLTATGTAREDRRDRRDAEDIEDDGDRSGNKHGEDRKDRKDRSDD